MSFDSAFLNISFHPKTLLGLQENNFTDPTPIQSQVIPEAIKGKDVFARAQTGTGKTGSYMIPLLEVLAHSRARAMMPRALILTPTRELSLQVQQTLQTLGKHFRFKGVCLIGGTSMGPQEKSLMSPHDVIIATPGRLIDMHERGRLLFNDIKMLVIDECDRLLDMGFMPDVEKIMGFLPKKRQTMLFSATTSKAVDQIAAQVLVNPVEIFLSTDHISADNVTQAAYDVPEKHKMAALLNMLEKKDISKAMIFCNRKTMVTKVYHHLKKHHKAASEIHGDLTQMQRGQVLLDFKEDKISYLVASDVAARGIDVDGLPYVINFDLPMAAEDYIHRIGRTGRAGQKGTAYSLVSKQDKKAHSQIQTLLELSLPLVSEAELLEEKPCPTSKSKESPVTPEPQPKKKPKNTIQKDPEDVGPGFGLHVPAFFQLSLPPCFQP